MTLNQFNYRKNLNVMDNLSEQIIAISKAGAYDAIAPHYAELQKEVEQLREDKAKLAIMLKGELARVQALKEFINETRPTGAELIPLGPIDKEIEQEFEDHNDLKDLNI